MFCLPRQLLSTVETVMEGAKAACPTGTKEEQCRHLVDGFWLATCVPLLEDLLTQMDAVVANGHPSWSCNESFNLIFSFPTERTVKDDPLPLFSAFPHISHPFMSGMQLLFSHSLYMSQGYLVPFRVSDCQRYIPVSSAGFVVAADDPSGARSQDACSPLVIVVHHLLAEPSSSDS